MSGIGEQHQEPAGDRISQRTLAESCLGVSSSLELSATLEAIAEEARRLMGSVYAGVHVLRESAEGHNVFAAGISISEFSQRHLVNSTAGVIPDSETDPTSSDQGEVPENGAGFLLAPLYLEDDHFADVYVSRKVDGGNFTGEDTGIFQSLILHAARAVSNSILYHSAQRIRAELENLIDNVPIGIFVFDMNSGILGTVNREGRRLSRGVVGPGSQIDEFHQLMALRSGGGEGIPEDTHPLARIIATGGPVASQPFAVTFPNSQSVTMLIGASPIFSHSGELSSAAIFIEDTSRLANLETLSVDLIDSISTALRKPLTTMKGSTSTALTAAVPLGPEEARQLFQILDNQLNSVRRMINDFSDIAKLESGTLELNLEKADISEVVEEARFLLREYGTEEPIQVNFPGRLPLVSIDRSRMVQVIANLLLHASHNWRGASEIEIKGIQEEPHVLVTIRTEAEADGPLRNSIGQAAFPGLIGSIWQFIGSGESDLTLPVCSGIISAHGGQIWLENDSPDSDTRIHFSLPIAQETDAEAETEVETRRRAPSMESATILVAGLRHTVVSHVRDTLTGVGYNPITAESSEEAERVAIANRPSLILLDFTLPQTEGLGLVRRIREVLDCPIVFLSAEGGDQDISTAFEMGAYDFISRPLSTAELIGRVNAAMRSQALSRSGQINSYVLGQLTINYSERRVTVGGHQVRLTATEYRLLSELSLNAGKVLTNSQLMRRVWGAQSTNDTRILRTFVKNLRRKLGDDAQSPAYIFTEPRVGYRMEHPTGVPQPRSTEQ